MADHSLRLFVQDNMVRLLGMSESTLVDYFIAQATSSKSPDHLLASLQAADLPTSDDARRFAHDLYQRVPRPPPPPSSSSSSTAQRRKDTKETLALLNKNDAYKLLLDDPLVGHPSSTDTTSSNKKRKPLPPSPNATDTSIRDKIQSPTNNADKPPGHHGNTGKRHLRQKEPADNDQWNLSLHHEPAVKRRKKSVTPQPTSDDERDRQREEDRLRDIKERDEFADRLKAKDKEKTKNLVQDKSSSDAVAATRRRLLANDREARKTVLDDLREISRQEYLGKREEQRLALLEAAIADEELLFKNETLSKRERDEFDYKKKLLKLAKERMAINDKVDAYHMPDDYITEKGKLDRKKQESVLYQRYQESNDLFVTDQDQWEQLQILKSLSKPGAKDRPQADEMMDYDFVFDESQHIDFVLASGLARLSSKEEAEQAELKKMSEAQRKEMSMQQLRQSLPIFVYRDQLLEAIQQFQVLVIVGETGSGKTTQIPQYLHEAGYTKDAKKIGCTQPRRVAAMSVAARVAEEMNVKLGYQVGYSIRFEDCTSDKTLIKYMTDGMLLREFLTEPDLASYSVLIIDEAHERTLHTDVLFGLVKDIARFRPDLKLLISSATMDAQKFSDYFDQAPIFNIPGRKFPVQVYYTAAPEANYLAAAITTIMQIHITQDTGDVLLFLTGQEEIEAAEESLKQISRSLGSKIRELIICPIYSTLPAEQQAKIFEPTPHGARKVVIATNIAETSITIDGIVYVIDPGFSKQKSYNPRTGMESLVIVPCSRASANQRKGRAGRVGPGKCFRLYTAWAYQNELDENTVPEIQRTNLGNVVLLLKSLGINDLVNFDFMDPPPAETLIRALEQLYALGALNDRGELTKLGRRMAEFPIDPMLSKTLIAAEKYGCTQEVVSIVSMLSANNALFYRPKDKAVHADKAKKNFHRAGGDHLMLLAVWNAWVETNYSIQWCFENYLQHKTLKRVRDVRDQLVGLMERTEVPLVSNPNPADTVPMRKAITAGFFYNTSKLQRSGDTYRTVKHSQTVSIHPSSSLFGLVGENPRWILYFELVLTTKEFMRQVIEIQPEWLLEVAPHYYKPKELEDDSNKKMPKTKGKASEFATR
ncbi:hypothetical protein SeMB42_g00606 [Synchytrium endobioticum]|uniref:RNA helicase n=1 Tax=Synchytrium endobioticum TaxID=286115 RepID=A0A507DRE0_9FUNG|nr:hypothetical protein SeLEV6574_g01271 [Synchytrium endobioticum]TPX53807.1 hypothetical protein SeMB42_g00606 [Synchytrium endobioticum]